MLGIDQFLELTENWAAGTIDMLDYYRLIGKGASYVITQALHNQHINGVLSDAVFHLT